MRNLSLVKLFWIKTTESTKGTDISTIRVSNVFENFKRTVTASMVVLT